MDARPSEVVTDWPSTRENSRPCVENFRPPALAPLQYIHCLARTRLSLLYVVDVGEIRELSCQERLNNIDP